MDEADELVLEWSGPDVQPGQFVELFWRHGAAVHTYLSRRSGRQNADDLLSEVWMRAFQSRASYDRRCPDARPWLYGIARNVLRAHWRLNGRPAAPSQDSVVVDPWPDADSRLDASSQAQTLSQMMAMLSVDEREVLLLVIWEQLAPAEVAIALGIPQGTARSRLHRALSVLRSEAHDKAQTNSPVLICSYPKES